MTQITCRLTAKNRDQLRNPTLGNRVWATFTFFGSSSGSSRVSSEEAFVGRCVGRHHGPGRLSPEREQQRVHAVRREPGDPLGSLLLVSVREERAG